MSDEKMIKNDPILAMHEEVKTTKLFEGFAVMDEEEGTIVYHEKCDVDIITLIGTDMDFALMLDQVLQHAAECDPDEDDDSDPWGDMLDDEEIEPV